MDFMCIKSNLFFYLKKKQKQNKKKKKNKNNIMHDVKGSLELSNYNA